nr:hypothetical protein [Streptomyces sp. 846.5]
MSARYQAGPAGAGNAGTPVGVDSRTAAIAAAHQGGLLRRSR